VLVLVVALVAGCRLGSAGPTSSPAPAGLQRVVDLLTRAALAGDLSGYRAQLSTADPHFGSTTDMLWGNLRALRPQDLRIAVSAARVPLSASRAAVLGPDAFVAQATLAWQLPGQRAEATATVWLTFTGTGDSLRLAGTTDGPAASAPPAGTPLWWLEPVTMVTGGIPGLSAYALVVATGAASPRGSTWAGLAAKSVTQATRRAVPADLVVLLVPGDVSRFVQVTGEPATVGLAGLTVVTGLDPMTAPSAVVVNPETAGRLDPDQLGLLLTHESVHAAMRSPSADAPLWIEEGFADAVAFDAYPRLARANLAELLTEASDNGAPAHPPADDAFAPDAGHLDLSYQLAWSACRFIADQRGWSALESVASQVTADPRAPWWTTAGQPSAAAFDRAWSAWLTRAAKAS